MAIFIAPGGANIFKADVLSTEVLIATVDGVVTLGRVGDAWQTTGHSLPGHHVSAIAEDPHTGRLVVGAYFGGIYWSDDGATWELASADVEALEVWSLISMQVDGATRFLAGTQPANVYVSDDGGSTWEILSAFRKQPTEPSWSFPSPPHVAHVKHIVPDPNEPTTLYACVEVGVLLRSRDSGVTWHEVLGTYEDVHRVVLHRDRPDRLVVPTGNGIYISEDRGRSFDRITDATSEIGGYPDPCVVLPTDPDFLLAAASHENPGTWRVSKDAQTRISRSRDGGRTWEVLKNGLPEHFRAHVAAMTLEGAGNASQVFVATTDGEILYSTDGGDQWTRIAEDLPAISKEKHHRILAPA